MVLPKRFRFLPLLIVLLALAGSSRSLDAQTPAPYDGGGGPQRLER
jgi:hypothetical protein